MAGQLIQWARPPYSKRDVPEKYDRGWWQTELGNLMRAFLPSTIRHVLHGDYKPTVRDSVLLADATGGTVRILLPTPSRVHGFVLTIKRIDNVLANAVTIIGTVDALVNPSLTAQYNGLQIVADDTGWWRLATF